jgi:hypothetical protein
LLYELGRDEVGPRGLPHGLQEARIAHARGDDLVGEILAVSHGAV